MARMTRAGRREETRDRLIAAARAVFAAHGLAAATIAQISGAAGFTTGAFYSNFPSKEALAREIASRDIEDDLSLVAQIGERADGGADALRAALVDAIDESTADTDRVRLRLELLLQASRDDALGQIVRTRIAVSRNRLGEVLEKLFQTLEPRPPMAAAELACLILTLNFGAKIMHLAGDPAAPGPLIDIVLAAIMGRVEPAAPGA